MTRDFEKTVAIKAVDEDERTATGAVLVPNEVDKQRDFLRPEGIAAMFDDDPDDGVMHAAFPDDAAELVRNEIVEEPIELNGESYPAGTWVATRKYDDDDLWKLVEDGILSGFSIGGEVSEVREFEAADVPDDVTFPDPVTPGAATEILNGQVDEVSDVDIPAVPRATFREVGKLGKSITDRVEDESEFVDVMETRGHDAEDARELWAYLQTHKQKRASADVEKPIVLPNGAEFDSFEACVDSVSGDGTSVAAAEQICGAGREKDVPGRYSDIDFAGYPDAAVENAERGLELRREHGRGGTQVGVTRAGQLANGERLSPDTVDRMVSFFARHEQNRPENPDPNDPSNGWIAWLLWGGDEARRWAESVVDRMDAADEEADIERASKGMVWDAPMANERAESRAGETKNDVMSDPDTETDESDAEKADATESISDVDDATLGQRIKAAFGFGDGTDDAVSPESGLAEDPADAEKAGRTLSQQNERAVMASIDAQIDVLDDAGVDHGMTRFTDRAEFAFDLEQYGKGSHDDKDETDKDAPAGETADTDMSNDESTDDTEKSDETPAWAESLTEKVESIEKRVDEMDDDAEKGLDDAPEWAKSLAEKVDDLDERVDKVSKATADTQQTGGDEQTGKADEELTESEKQKRAVFLPNGGR